MPRRKNISIEGQYVNGYGTRFTVDGKFFKLLLEKGRVVRRRYVPSERRKSAFRYWVWGPPRVYYLTKQPGVELDPWYQLLENEVGAGKFPGFTLYPHRKMQLTDAGRYVPRGEWVCTEARAKQVSGGMWVGTGDGAVR